MGQNNTNSDNSENSMNSGREYDLISALIDNELTDSEREVILQQLASDTDIKNRHSFEKAVKSEIKSRVTRIETPQYVYQNIQTSINTYTDNISAEYSRRYPAGTVVSSSIRKEKKGNPRNYFYLFGSVAAIMLIFFLFTNFFNAESIPDNVNLVEISRGVYEKVQSGDIKIQYATSNAQELEKWFDEKMDYEVFVPDVKDAMLIGGVYNEMGGKKAAHFIHKKGDTIIYTLQLCKKDILDDNNKEIMLAGDMKENVKVGKNWLHCPKKQGGKENIILWHKDDAISSSVSKMDADQIHAVLTNYK